MTLRTAVCLLSMFPLAIAGRAADLLFHAPYESDLNATEAKGDSWPAKVQGEFTFGKSTLGPALQVGTTNSYLLYKADKNVDGNQGTVALWVQPDWLPTDGKFHQFWTFLGNGVFILYKAGGGDNKLHFLVTGHDTPRSSFVTVDSAIESWKPGEPHHLAATWEPGTLRLYVDGQLAATHSDAGLGLPQVWPDNVFFVGDYYHAGYGIQSGLSGRADTLIRDFRLYGQALSAEQIAELAGVKKKRQ